jgi:hypothetical protein
MAAKPKQSKVDEDKKVIPVNDPANPDTAVVGDQPEESGEAPDSAYPDGGIKDNGAGAGREPQIAKEPKKSFDERTGVGTPPWLNKDGSQNTGEVVAE